MELAVAAVAVSGFAAVVVALTVSALAETFVFGFDVALRTGAFLAADALLEVALLGDWERAFVVIGKSAYHNALAFFAAFSSNLVLHWRV